MVNGGAAVLVHVGFFLASSISLAMIFISALPSVMFPVVVVPRTFPVSVTIVGLVTVAMMTMVGVVTPAFRISVIAGSAVLMVLVPSAPVVAAWLTLALSFSVPLPVTISLSFPFALSFLLTFSLAFPIPIGRGVGAVAVVVPVFLSPLPVGLSPRVWMRVLPPVAITLLVTAGFVSSAVFNRPPVTVVAPTLPSLVGWPSLLDFVALWSSVIVFLLHISPDCFLRSSSLLLCSFVVQESGLQLSRTLLRLVSVHLVAYQLCILRR